ncbi:unannotated protein [freshwater metagenome]|uniref:Unannotated protein n=1 Tax=freshwater metagenome TaxID=449393 RepID=A0A6J6GLB3_9ZZZZ
MPPEVANPDSLSAGVNDDLCSKMCQIRGISPSVPVEKVDIYSTFTKPEGNSACTRA